MGGKGQRRREKNWLSAHGGGTRLPPPPKQAELDTIPSKLRRLIKLKNADSKSHSDQGSMKESGDARPNNRKGKKEQRPVTKEAGSKNTQSTAGSSSKGGDENRKIFSSDQIKGKDSNTKANSDVMVTRKRKRGAVQDLRFQEIDQTSGLSKKARKKEFLNARKKKRKKTETDNVVDFPGREKIKFGEVVVAPPKLSFPKMRKSLTDASTERVRLEAVEAYRKKRGWVNRPGLQLPDL